MSNENTTAPLEKRAALLAAKVRNRHCDERGDVNAYELARATEVLLVELDRLRDQIGRVVDLTTWDDGEQREDVSVDELLHALRAGA